MANYLFTSESVTEGHPDKICDQISDAVLDAMLQGDPQSRVACECAATTGMVLIMGEITSKSQVDIPALARRVICDIGYDRSEYGFDGNTCNILTSLDRQSPDIAMGVSLGSGGAGSVGAGDQGMMFGFACDETAEYMPLTISLSHRLTRRLAEVRRGSLPYLRPDGKAQVTVEYDGYTPVRISAVVVSSQHAAEVDIGQVRQDILEQVIAPVLPKGLCDERTRYFINPTGRFVVGGPMGDSGVTGRKIIVDTYGGWGRHGGGAFSGKDPTKVDRSAAYAARYVAKNIVAAGLASRCEVQLAYAIGVAEPVSVNVNTFGTGKRPTDEIEAAVRRTFDLRPAAIIDSLGLRSLRYQPLASYGHMGREELNVSFERTDRVEELLENI
ncbi:methionine adenosyltransferase [Harryflintia acetispora]|uniref:S-adenosylmethionine synthase n=1 Tax=Harryflintia acetispora TaxID=1849041 RepID=A0A9X8UIG9_9FIRM|nr:methionine adenosyltransferase [Harryflintia acetispora]TCL42820.1 methionine adenosyltransferase [Harryflintia acetispora]